MLTKPGRINIFVGALGSGKTEIALNFAVKLHDGGEKVTVVDLDIINPYFRTRVVREYLEGKGLAVVSPQGKLAGADLPALSPAIHGVMEGYGGCGVFDVGGDDIGATALGRYKTYLPEGAFNLFLVINTCRPFTRDVDGITTLLRGIERASRLRVTALVSNTNLGSETDVATILEGHGIVKEAARTLDLPIAFMGVRRELVEAVGKVDVPVLPVELFMKPPWYDGGEQEAVAPLLRVLPR